RRREQDLDDRLVELFEEFFPERLARQRGKLVDAVFLFALGDLGGRKALFGGEVQILSNRGDGAHAESGRMKSSGQRLGRRAPLCGENENRHSSSCNSLRDVKN